MIIRNTANLVVELAQILTNVAQRFLLGEIERNQIFAELVRNDRVIEIADHLGIRGELFGWVCDRIDALKGSPSHAAS